MLLLVNKYEIPFDILIWKTGTKILFPSLIGYIEVRPLEIVFKKGTETEKKNKILYNKFGLCMYVSNK